jgi:hypothetical protein
MRGCSVILTNVTKVGVISLSHIAVNGMVFRVIMIGPSRATVLAHRGQKYNHAWLRFMEWKLQC